MVLRANQAFNWVRGEMGRPSLSFSQSCSLRVNVRYKDKGPVGYSLQLFNFFPSLITPLCGVGLGIEHCNTSIAHRCWPKNIHGVILQSEDRSRAEARLKVRNE